MPRSRSIPRYRRHKARDCAVVRIDGRDFYLGTYGSTESHEKYARLIAEHAASPKAGSPPFPKPGTRGGDVSVTELVAAFWVYAKQHYQQDGRPTGHCKTIRAALRPLVDLYGSTPASLFSPRSLKTLRQHLIELGWSRSYINASIGKVRRAFSWGVEEELVEVSVHQALLRVGGLQKGRSTARETEPVGPVGEATVEATLPYLPSIVADMVRVQRLLGCRPGEVCGIRPGDLDTSGAVWVYVPTTHKTEHHGIERRIFVGPKAQAIMRPYLDRAGETYCFSPAESMRRFWAEQRAKRESRVQPSQVSRRKAKPKRQAAGRYAKDAYNWAIRRACDRADAVAHNKDPSVPAETRIVPRWHPNQLRHSAATEIRQRFGLEAAQVVLGHSRADVTQVYAERDQSKAAAIMLEIG